MFDTQHKLRCDPQQLTSRLGGRHLVFVGLMGAGKTVIGRLVAEVLGLPFVDSDHEIENVSTMSIPELFEQYGEKEFRALEARVIERLLKGTPIVLSTGGGAFMHEGTRNAIREHAISIWLKADLDTLMSRVSRRGNRPLLRQGDPRATMRRLMNQRHPVYALADLTIVSRNERKEATASEVLNALGKVLGVQLANETGQDEG